MECTQYQIEGEILNLSAVRDTLARQEALCQIDINPLENQTVDFRLGQTSGNMLQKLLGDIGF